MTIEDTGGDKLNQLLSVGNRGIYRLFADPVFYGDGSIACVSPACPQSYRVGLACGP